DYRTPARGDNQSPILNLRSVAEPQRPVAPLHGLDRDTGNDSEVRVILIPPEESFVLRQGTVHKLGEQRPVIANLRLSINKGYGFFLIGPGKTQRRLHAGDTTANHYAIHNLTPTVVVIRMVAMQW
ncbi:MAG: hypothetical protein P8X39_02485, partial [Desulfofustis sp.]